MLVAMPIAMAIALRNASMAAVDAVTRTRTIALHMYIILISSITPTFQVSQMIGLCSEVPPWVRGDQIILTSEARSDMHMSKSFINILKFKFKIS